MATVPTPRQRFRVEKIGIERRLVPVCPIGDLPDDMLIKILSNVSTETGNAALGCAEVSRRWRSIMSSSVTTIKLIKKTQDMMAGVPLAKLTGLSSLWIEDCTLPMMWPQMCELLGTSCKNLATICITRVNPRPNLVDVQELVRQCEKLEMLDLDGMLECQDFPTTGPMLRLKRLSLAQLHQLEALGPLDGLSNLEVLILSNCTALRAMPDVRPLSLLRTLNVSGCSLLEQLPDLQALPLLEILDASQCDRLVVVNVGGLHFLRQLSLNCCKRLVTVNGMEQSVHLKVLGLYRCPSFQVLEPLDKPAFSLESLGISWYDIDNLGIRSAMAGVKRLYLNGYNGRSDGLGKLSELEELTVSGGDLPCLTNLHSLQRVTINSYLIKVVECRHYPFSLKHLAINNFGGGSYWRLKVRNLDAVTGLESLSITNRKVAGIPHLHKLHHLTRLRIVDCEVLRDLQLLHRLLKLEELSLAGCGQLQCVPPLKDLRSLRSLDLGCCVALEYLPDLPLSLRNLVLTGCLKLSELPTFEDLVSLENIDMSFCPKLKRLPSFDNLPNLKHVNVRGCSWEISNGLLRQGLSETVEIITT